jgi:hypothetical protein
MMYTDASVTKAKRRESAGTSKAGEGGKPGGEEKAETRGAGSTIVTSTKDRELAGVLTAGVKVLLWLHHGEASKGNRRGWNLVWASGSGTACKVELAKRKGKEGLESQVWCRSEADNKGTNLEGQVEVGEEERWLGSNTVDMSLLVWEWADSRGCRVNERELARTQRVPRGMEDQHGYVERQLRKVTERIQGAGEREWRAARPNMVTQLGTGVVEAAEAIGEGTARPATAEEEDNEADGGKVDKQVLQWRKLAGSRAMQNSAEEIEARGEAWLKGLVGSGVETGGVCPCAVQGGSVKGAAGRRRRVRARASTQRKKHRGRAQGGGAGAAGTSTVSSREEYTPEQPGTRGTGAKSGREGQLERGGCSWRTAGRCGQQAGEGWQQEGQRWSTPHGRRGVRWWTA